MRTLANCRGTNVVALFYPRQFSCSSLCNAGALGLIVLSHGDELDCAARNGETHATLGTRARINAAALLDEPTASLLFCHVAGHLCESGSSHEKPYTLVLVLHTFKGLLHHGRRGGIRRSRSAGTATATLLNWVVQFWASHM